MSSFISSRFLASLAAVFVSTHGLRKHRGGSAISLGLGQQNQTRVEISGGKLLVNGEPFHMKGVCWNPVPKGATHPEGLDYAGFVDADSLIMQEAGINVLRPYEPITDTAVLDKLFERGIYVVNSAYSYGGEPAQSAVDVVNAVKDHPAILMWAVGNEWNYNGIYLGYSDSFNFFDARDRVKEVVDLIKAADPAHPVSTIYGELPDNDTLAVLSNVDVWGINAYRGIGFSGGEGGTLFTDWKHRSDKLMYMGEYGADAYDARGPNPNYTAQADATRELTNLIVAESAVNGGVCLGGLIFEFADEWWKDKSEGSAADKHDTGGIAPGGGPYPDATFNEEWWGLLDIDRQPRAAFQEYKATINPMLGAPPKEDAGWRLQPLALLWLLPVFASL